MHRPQNSAGLDLTLDNLKEIDANVIGETFNLVRAECVKDMEQRPGERKARQIVIKLNLTPLENDGGMLEEVGVDFEIDKKLPKRRTRPYIMRPRKNGSLTFQPASPENPNQLGLDSISNNQTNGDGNDD